MYYLNVIGELVAEGEKVVLKLKKEYRRGLKYAELFSHLHVFYKDRMNNFEVLHEMIMEMLSVDMKKGVIEFIPRNLGQGKAEAFDHQSNSMQKKVEVFDVKPYFPCEDSVRNSECKSEQVKVGTKVFLKPGNTSKIGYTLEDIGQIKNRDGKKYIELKQGDALLDLEGCSHIKIIWWFHKFDEANYRRCVECDPPYENAPRTGVFATRSPVRPNPIALTIARMERYDPIKRRIYINDIECFDGTPCIAIWPYRKEDLVMDIKLPQWLEHWPRWLEDRSNSEFTGKAGRIDSAQESIYYEGEEVTEAEIQELFALKEERNDAEGIYVEGARENNLKGINCTIPYHKITAVVGVSGSGKSSLVQDTIYTECQRRMGCLTDDSKIMRKPNMDGMYGSIPAIMISQKEIGKNSRSTVGTYSNAYDYLRIIYAAVGIRHCPECGHPIHPISEEEILSLLQKKDRVRIYDINKLEIMEGTLTEKVRTALTKSHGALYAGINEEAALILLQTRQKCYVCDRLMFELTPTAFNYSDVESMCPECNGYGEKNIIDSNSIIENPELSILEGASSWWGKLRNFQKNPNANWMKGEVIGLAEAMKVDLEKPWIELPEEFRKKVIYGSEGELVTFQYSNKKNGRTGTIVRPVEGVFHILERLYSENDHTDVLSKYVKKVVCDCCNGERLNAEGRLVSIGEIRYPQVAQMAFHDIVTWCRNQPRILPKTHFELIEGSLQRLYELSVCAEQLGLGYLELDRNTATLSGGEGQRLKFLSSMQNRLTGVLYIMDEPSKGLHQKDYGKIANMIEDLKRSGNTVIMVEHNEDMIKIADNVIEIGPSAGDQGGYLMGEGSLEAMCSHQGTQLSRYFKEDNSKSMYTPRQLTSQVWLEIEGVKYHNLKNITLSLPVNAVTCICGVSGSGKSSLMKGVIFPEVTKLIKHSGVLQYSSQIKNADLFDSIILVEQSAIGRSPRSVPATYIGIMDTIRELFSETEDAQAAGINVASFSFNNAEGQCDHCHGDGQIEPKFLQDIWITCPSCNGKRYNKHILGVKYQGKDIAQVLQMSVTEAGKFFCEKSEKKEMKKALKILEEVGLGYLKLGQSLVTLSGGEASRLKLAKELISKTKKHTLYLIDEPTTGLHFSDIENLIKLFQKLVEEGNTIVLIEHNKQIIRNCDWIIELGPGAGYEGGYVISQGRSRSHEV